MKGYEAGGRTCGKQTTGFFPGTRALGSMSSVVESPRGPSPSNWRRTPAQGSTSVLGAGSGLGRQPGARAQRTCAREERQRRGHARKNGCAPVHSTCTIYTAATPLLPRPCDVRRPKVPVVQLRHAPNEAPPDIVAVVNETMWQPPAAVRLFSMTQQTHGNQNNSGAKLALKTFRVPRSRGSEPHPCRQRCAAGTASGSDGATQEFCRPCSVRA